MDQFKNVYTYNKDYENQNAEHDDSPKSGLSIKLDKFKYNSNNPSKSINLNDNLLNNFNNNKSKHLNFD